MTRLLLRQAVERSQAQDEVHGVDANHRPVGKQLGQDPQGLAVGRVVERRHEDGRIGNVEIRVAGGQA